MLAARRLEPQPPGRPRLLRRAPARAPLSRPSPTHPLGVRSAAASLSEPTRQVDLPQVRPHSAPAVLWHGGVPDSTRMVTFESRVVAPLAT